MPQCTIPNCKMRSDGRVSKQLKISFHSFPKEERLKRAWTEAVGRPAGWEPCPSSMVCALHFRPEDIDKSSPFKTYVTKGAVPSVFPCRDGRYEEALRSKIAESQLRISAAKGLAKKAGEKCNGAEAGERQAEVDPLSPAADHQLQDDERTGGEEEESKPSIGPDGSVVFAAPFSLRSPEPTEERRGEDEPAGRKRRRGWEEEGAQLDEYDFFAKSLAVQLRKMPGERALACMERLLGVVKEERLRLLGRDEPGHSSPGSPSGGGTVLDERTAIFIKEEPLE